MNDVTNKDKWTPYRHAMPKESPPELIVPDVVPQDERIWVPAVSYGQAYYHDIAIHSPFMVMSSRDHGDISNMIGWLKREAMCTRLPAKHIL